MEGAIYFWRQNIYRGIILLLLRIQASCKKYRLLKKRFFACIQVLAWALVHHNQGQGNMLNDRLLTIVFIVSSNAPA